MTRKPAMPGRLAVLLMALALFGCAEREVILPGERFEVRTPLSESQPVEGEAAPAAPGAAENRSVPIRLAAPVVNADWTHRGQNIRHLAPHVALSSQPVRVWSASIGTGNSRRYRLSATPVVAGGRIFTLDARASVAATSTGGGTLWTADLTPASDRGGEASGGGLAFGEGRLYVTTAFGDLVAMDPATGGVVWRQRLAAPVTGAPTVANGIVYAVARDGSGWAVDAADGTLRWTLPGTPSLTGVVGAAAPAVADSLVLLPFSSGQVIGALRSGGLQLWSASVAGGRLGRGFTVVSDISADPVVAGPVTYVGNQRGRTVALTTASGKPVWTATEGASSSIAVGGGSIFLVNDEARLVRLDAGSGEVIWSVPMPFFTNDKPRKQDAIYAHYGPVLAGGRVVVASSDGVLRLFNPADGALTATAELPGGAASAPVVAGGVLYVLGSKGQLHAFR